MTNVHNQISPELSNTLKICNLLCTLLVVAIHFNSKVHIDLSAGYTVNYYIQEFITNGIARIAVPFFAFASGLFFFQRFQLQWASYKVVLSKRSISLFIPYVFGALIILLTEALYGREFSFSALTFNDYLHYVLLRPVSVQFWFIRDLIFLALISPVIYFLLLKTKFVLPLLVMTAWFIDYEFMPLLAERHIISTEVGGFFILGAFCRIGQLPLEKVITKQPVLLMLVISLALLVTRIIIEPNMANWYHDTYTATSLVLQNVFIVMALMWVLALSYHLKDKTKLLWLSQFTFFVYLYHLLPVSRLVVKLSDYVIADAYKFYLTTPLSLIVTFGLAIICARHFGWLYNIVSGGRAS